MKNFKLIGVYREDTECEEVLLFRDMDEEDGQSVVIIAWHYDKEEDMAYQQCERIEMPEEMISDYIRDFSTVSAQNFVNKFKI